MSLDPLIHLLALTLLAIASIALAIHFAGRRAQKRTDELLQKAEAAASRSEA